MYPIVFRENIEIMGKTIEFEIPQKAVLLEKMITCLPYEERTMELFIPGKDIKETYENMRKSKYGKGGIELMAFGVVPYLDNLTKDPDALAKISHLTYVQEAGSEGIELVMWLIMRGALNQTVSEIHRHYHVPASNTAVGHIILENI
jgi:hypothetical protein